MTMTQHDFLLYGANGYTGQLIARYAADYDCIVLGEFRSTTTGIWLRPLGELCVVDCNCGGAVPVM